MQYEERRQNLFEMDEKYYLAHCISADYAMGAGIAVQFKKEFPYIVSSLKQHQPGVGGVCLSGRVFNLVTKSKYYGKPTYDILRASLEKMMELCRAYGIRHLAMPLIGCGLDRLSWGKVREILLDVFNGLDVKIVVCRK